MDVCSICASLKSMAKGGKLDEDINNYKNLLKEHVMKVKPLNVLKLCTRNFLYFLFGRP